METVAAASEDILIDSLSYKLGNSASYVTDRNSVTFHPSGSNIYTPGSGTKVKKIQVNSEGWLDTSTVVVNFDLHNNDLTSTNFFTIIARWTFIFQAIKDFSRW